MANQFEVPPQLRAKIEREKRARAARKEHLLRAEVERLTKELMPKVTLTPEQIKNWRKIMYFKFGSFATGQT